MNTPKASIMLGNRRVAQLERRLSSLEQQIERLRQKNAEHRNAERRYRSLIGGSIQGVFVHRNFEFLFVNDALVRVFGYRSKREMLSLPSVDALLAPGERKRIRQFAKRRMQKGTAPNQYEFEGVKKNGSRIWMSNIARLIDWDGKPAFLLVSTVPQNLLY